MLLTAFCFEDSIKSIFAIYIAAGTKSFAEPTKLLITGRHDSCAFEHQNDRSAQRVRTVHYSARDHHCLTWQQVDFAALILDTQASLENDEKFVFVFVLVPMKVSVQHSKARDAIMTPTKV